MAKKILLVEDFPIIQKLYSDALLDAGYKVKITGSGDEALKLAKRTHFDIILLDLLLLGMGGLDFMQVFKPLKGKTKVLVLTDFMSNRILALGNW